MKANPSSMQLCLLICQAIQSGAFVVTKQAPKISYRNVSRHRPISRAAKAQSFVDSNAIDDNSNTIIDDSMNQHDTHDKIRPPSRRELLRWLCRRTLVSAAACVTMVWWNGHDVWIASARNLPQSTGADASRVGTIDTLVPIVQLQQSLLTLQSALSADSSTNEKSRMRSIAQSIPRNEQKFKRVFDEYSIPVSYKQRFMDQNAFLVYYTQGFDGPGRPRLEDAATSSSVLERLQSSQFGYRNDAWIAYDAFCVEFEYPDADLEELRMQIDRAIAALDGYIGTVSPSDVSTALTIIRERNERVQ